MSLSSDTTAGLAQLDKQGSTAAAELDALMTQMQEAKKNEAAIQAKNRELDQNLLAHQSEAVQNGLPVMMYKDPKTGQVGLTKTPQDMIDAVTTVKVNRVKALMAALDPSAMAGGADPTATAGAGVAGGSDAPLPSPNAIAGGPASAPSASGALPPPTATASMATPPPAQGVDPDAVALKQRGINPKTYLFAPRMTLDEQGNATPKFDTFEEQQKRADALTSKVEKEQPAIPEYMNIKGTTKAAVDYVEPLLKSWDKTGKAPNLVAAQSTLESALTQVQMGIQSQVRAGLLNQTDAQSLGSYFNGLYTKATSGGKGLDKASMKTMLSAIKDLNDSHAELYNEAILNVKRQAKLNGVSPEQIDAVYPKAKMYYPSFETEEEARKAGHKTGDKVRIAGQKGTLK